jgi:hypothetical protein
VGAAALARAASGAGCAGSATIRQTRFGTVLPVVSTFWQTFLGLAGFAGWLAPDIAGGAAVVVSGEVADRARERKSVSIRIKLLDEIKA